MTQFDGKSHGIDYLLGPAGFKKKLVVNPPQRRFKWGLKQVRDLWQDILEAQDKPYYYFGPVTLSRAASEDERSILDGQQRLIALSMVAAVLRDILRQLFKHESVTVKKADEAKGLADNLDSLIKRKSSLGHSQGPVLRLQTDDRRLFHAYVETQPGDNGHLGPNEPFLGIDNRRNRFLRVASYFAKEAERVVGSLEGDAALDELLDLGQFLYGKLIVVVIEVPSESEHYVIFDRSNSRGLPLDNPGRIKSTLMALAVYKGEQDPFLENWDQMSHELEKVSESALEDFLRVFWISNHSHVSAANLYGAFVSEIREKKQSPSGLSTDLLNSAHSYTSLIEPSDKDPVKADLLDLRSMGLVQSLPLLLAAKEVLSPVDFEGIVDLAITLQIRNVIIGPRQANEYEKEWVRWARMLRNDELKNVREQIAASTVGDEQFKNAFAKATIRVPAAARHLLRRIEYYGNSHQMPPVGIDVEHVAPKSLLRVLKNQPTKRNQAWLEELGMALPLSADSANREVGWEKWTPKSE